VCEVGSVGQQTICVVVEGSGVPAKLVQTIQATVACHHCMGMCKAVLIRREALCDVGSHVRVAIERVQFARALQHRMGVCDRAQAWQLIFSVGESSRAADGVISAAGFSKHCMSVRKVGSARREPVCDPGRSGTLAGERVQGVGARQHGVSVREAEQFERKTVCCVGDNGKVTSER